MANPKFDFRQFASSADTVAAAVPADQVFGLLTRSIELPATWAALAAGEHGHDAVIEAGGRVGADGVRDVLFFRATPLTLRFQEQELTSSDAYLCDATVTVSVAIVAERADLLSMRNAVMGSRRALRLGDLEQYLRWPVRQTLIAFAEKHTADDLADGASLEAFRAALTDALGRVCFASGLALQGDARVSFTSAGLARTRAEAERAAIAGELHETREQLQAAFASARDKHLSHLHGVLGQIEQIAGRATGVKVADLVRTFTEQDRAQIYETLWHLLPPRERTRWLVAAVGNELLFYDPSGDERPVRRVALPEPAGMLRSITFVRDEINGPLLLVGAHRGVHVIAPDADAPVMSYLFDESVGELRGGVNGAALTRERVFCTHSEVGLVSWLRKNPNDMQRLLTPLTEGAKVVRHVRVHDGQLWFSADDNVVCVPLDHVDADERAVLRSVGRSFVSSLQIASTGVYAGTDDGRVLFWREGDTGRPEQIATGRDEPVESVECRLLGGVDRVVFTDSSDGIKSRILGDTFQCLYEGAHTPVRRCEVAEDLLAGVSGNRDKIFCWLPHTPAAPSAVLHVSRLTGRTVQDIALIPAA